MSARRLLLWTVPLWLLPLASIATGVYLIEQQPSCPGGFIDGPCDPGYDPWAGLWLFWLGVVGLAVEVPVLAGALVLWFVRR